MRLDPPLESGLPQVEDAQAASSLPDAGCVPCGRAYGHARGEHGRDAGRTVRDLNRLPPLRLSD